jgi:hypothetical protein
MGIIMTENIYRHIAAADKDQEPFPNCLRRRVRSRRRHYHGSLEHARLVHPGVLPQRPGGQDVPPARVHQDLRHRRVGRSRHHGRAAVCYFLFPAGEMVQARRVVAGRGAGRRKRFRHARRPDVDDDPRPLQRLAHVYRRGRHRRAGRGANDARALSCRWKRIASLAASSKFTSRHCAGFWRTRRPSSSRR